MMGFARGSLVSLLSVGILLCVAIVLEVAAWQQQPFGNTSAQVAAPRQGIEPRMSLQSDQQGSWFQLIISRPLFSPDRKPIGPDALSVHGLPRLTGIVVTDSHRIAIFAGSSGSHPIVVEAGSRLGAYDVRDITDAGVTVIGTEGTTLIRPSFSAAPASTPTAPLSGRAPLPRPTAK